MPKPLSNEHTRELQSAKYLLENPSIAARFSNSIASPIEKGMALLPAGASKTILSVAKNSLEAALNAALLTIGDEQQSAWNLTHKATEVDPGGWTADRLC